MLKINNFSKCEYCHKVVKRNQVIRFENKKSKRYMDLCSECGTRYYKDVVKNVEIDKSTLQYTGLYKQGANVADVKSYLEKWIKNNITEV